MTAVVRRTGTGPAATDPVRIAELRLALNEQCRFRIEQLTELAARAENQSTNAGDPRDEVADALQAGAMSALAEIAAALVRMDVGRYGRCETCGVAIPLERLEILPMAALCMRCQRLQEARRAR